MMIRTYLILIVTGIFFSSCTRENETKLFDESTISVIPKPTKIEMSRGYFQFDKNTVFVLAKDEQQEIASELIDRFNVVADWKLKVVNDLPDSNYVQFLQLESFEDEGYKIEVDSKKILIKASNDAGFLYGIETLRQLLPAAIESSIRNAGVDWIIPSLDIEDAPRFSHRGLMLDVSRHFFDIDYLKKTIDRLALLKMNVLHLHLVDDQGWRIEIKKYPKLTEKGAWRVDQEDKHWSLRERAAADEKGSYGGYYTQDELKDLVAYAALKNVEIIPEIEMPAHVSSAIAAYPELSCLEHPISVPSGGLWPITDIYCAGKEATFEFLEDVLLEVMAIFPSKYIHVGGDEATKTNWEQCPHCQKRMKTEELKTPEELQSYFIKRMEGFINSKGKRLIGWDEILEGGIAPEATVMSWRGVKGGVKAASEGHDVIMTPVSHCYFDYYQGPQDDEPLAWGGYTPLSKVYTFDPIVEGMSATEAKHVLGGQANLWSEYIPDESQSEYMLYPRLIALSETLWTTKDLKSWEDFSNRIEGFFDRMDYMDINYAKSAYIVMHDEKFDEQTGETSMMLNNEFPSADIRYSLNDQVLDEKAISYTQPIKVNQTTQIQYALFKDGKPSDRISKTTIKFHKAVGKAIEFKYPYHQNYKGENDYSLVNTVRGSKNFHDGHWQAWINNPMEAVIDLESSVQVSKVGVGVLQYKGAGIYFPSSVQVFLSEDGKLFHQVKEVQLSDNSASSIGLKDIEVDFTPQNTRYIKIIAYPHKANGTFLFVDELLVE